MTVDTNGSIGMPTPAKVSLKSLHVQDKGTFHMNAYTKDKTFILDSTNITVSFCYMFISMVYFHKILRSVLYSYIL